MAALHPQNSRPRIVIVGGGVSALETLLALRAALPDRLDIRVVSASQEFSYRPAQVAEPFGLGPARRYAISALCGANGADVLFDAVDSVDTEAHTLTTASGRQIGYDILVLALGAHAYPAFEHGVTFDRETVPEDFDEVLAASGEGFADQLAIVVPAGATWTLPAYELAMLTSWHSPKSEVTLVTYEHSPLCAFGAVAAEGVTEVLDAAGIKLRVGQEAHVESATALRLGWEWLEASRIVSLPLLSGPRLAGVPCDEHGFIPVDAHGRVEGIEDVYAAGDGTTIAIKQGGLAAQQADAAAAHIAARLGADIDPEPLRPVLRGLLVTRDGPRYLRAELRDPDGTSAISTEPLWWPPSKIASRALAPYLARLDIARSAGVVPGHAV
jgi:sulfide:quinone oxidoreductase